MQQKCNVISQWLKAHVISGAIPVYVQYGLFFFDYHTFKSAIRFRFYTYLTHAYLPLHEILMTHSTHTGQIRHETPADTLLALCRQQ